MLNIKNMPRVCTASILFVCAILPILFYYLFIKPDTGDLFRAAMRDDIAGIDRSLRSGVDVNGVEKWGIGGNNLGRTPLSVALQYANIDTISHLIRSGADVNLTNGFGYTPACVAALRGDPKIIQLLSEAGADFTIASDGHTPIEWANIASHEEAARLIERIIAEP